MLKNQEQAQNITEMINTLIEASIYLYNHAKLRDFSSFRIIAQDMMKVLETINGIAPSLKEEIPSLNIDLACESVINSLERIIIYSKTRGYKLLNKIEFELIPLLKDMLMRFYFWGCVYPDKGKMEFYYKNEMIPLCYNDYIDDMEKNGEYKYDLSVVVIAYNKLDYTKLCITNLLKYMPESINYELILVNHGSTDGTKEYFEGIAPTKQIDILRNGGGMLCFSRVIEGKYCLGVSNDVIVTEDAIMNMVRCIESDDKIAYVVPTTPNVSNMQTIPFQYANIEQMHNFAKLNNVYNTYRHEQRVRLCDPIVLCRSKYLYSSNGVCSFAYFFTAQNQSFPDDQSALLLRRRGYKMILAKDAFCHHFGSITLGEEIAKKQQEQKVDFYLEGRKAFYNAFGIDPWGTGFCYSPPLFTLLPCNNTNQTNVLGINCGIGSNPLKVRESIKENSHNLDVKIYNITDDYNVVEDLKGVSDEVKYVKDSKDFVNTFTKLMFDYIIFESGLENMIDPIGLVTGLNKYLTNDGVFAIYVIDINFQNQLKQRFKNIRQAENWFVL